MFQCLLSGFLNSCSYISCWKILVADLCLVSAMPKKILNAKIACLDFSLQKTKMKLGVQVYIYICFTRLFTLQVQFYLLLSLFFSPGSGD